MLEVLFSSSGSSVVAGSHGSCPHGSDDSHPHVAFSAPQQAKRLPPPAISLRSKSMTSELEEMGEPEGLLGLRAREGRGGGWTVPRVC